MKPKTTSLRWVLGTALLAASAAQATEPTATPAADGQVSAENGVRAYIDPATGKLRQPTAAERAEEARQAAAARKANAGKGRAPTVSKRKDGTVMVVDNDGRFMESMVATVNADGSISYSYQQGDVAGIVAAPASAPASEEK